MSMSSTLIVSVLLLVCVPLASISLGYLWPRLLPSYLYFPLDRAILSYTPPDLDYLDIPFPSTRQYVVHPGIHLRAETRGVDRLAHALTTHIDLKQNVRWPKSAATDVLGALRHGPSQLPPRGSVDEPSEKQGEINLQDMIGSVLINIVNRILRLSSYPNRFWSKHTLGNTTWTDIILMAKAGIEVKSPELSDEGFIAVWISARNGGRFKLTASTRCLADGRRPGAWDREKMLMAVRQVGATVSPRQHPVERGRFSLKFRPLNDRQLTSPLPALSLPCPLFAAPFGTPRSFRRSIKCRTNSSATVPSQTTTSTSPSTDSPRPNTRSFPRYIVPLELETIEKR